MKKTLLLLTACFICLTACQNVQVPASSLPAIQGDASSSAPLEKSPKAADTSSSTSSISTASALEHQPADDLLTVPVKILMEYDKPVIYATSDKGAELGTAAQLDRYMEWIGSLAASEITAIHAYSAPTDEYTQGGMTLADSNTLFAKLKSMKPTVFPASNKDNPPTGGGWGVAIQASQEKISLFFNGAWLVVSFGSEEPDWIFSTEDNGTNDIARSIDDLISENMDNGTAVPPTPRYKGDIVQSVYALSTASYVMARVEEYSLSTRVLSQLEGYQPDGSNPDNRGYVVFTDKGKAYIYLDDTNAALSKDCAAALSNTPLHPSWLIHMTPDRLVSANGITDKAAILKLCGFLKENVTVQGETTTHEGPTNPETVGGLYRLKLEFDSGVYYDLIGYDYFDTTGDLSIYASDLDTTIHYRCDSGISSKLRLYIDTMG